jgi:hypothetical protein
MPALNNVTEAKEAAMEVDSSVFADTVLMAASKTEIGDFSQDYGMSVGMFDDNATQLGFIKEYFDHLVALLATNKMHAANEKEASKLAQEAIGKAKALSKKTEEIQASLAAVVSEIDEATDMGKSLLTTLTTLNGQIIIVMTR